MAELHQIIVFHGHHFARHLGFCYRICVKLLQLICAEETPPGDVLWRRPGKTPWDVSSHLASCNLTFHKNRVDGRLIMARDYRWLSEIYRWLRNMMMLTIRHSIAFIGAILIASLLGISGRFCNFLCVGALTSFTGFISQLNYKTFCS